MARVVGAAVIAGVVLCVSHSDGGRREETPLPTAGGRDGVRTIRIVPSKCPVRSQEDFVASPDVSAAVAVVCGRVDASADRYGLRNDALRSIARRRDLSEGDVAALMVYVASGGGRRDAVADTVAVGTLGLLGDASDIALLESVAARGGSRLTEPCATAIERISGRIVK